MQITKAQQPLCRRGSSCASMAQTKMHHPVVRSSSGTLAQQTQQLGSVKRVLLAMDESSEFDAVARWTSKALLLPGDSLHLLRVVSPSPDYLLALTPDQLSAEMVPLAAGTPAAELPPKAATKTNQWYRARQRQELVLQEERNICQHFAPLIESKKQVSLHAHVVPTSGLMMKGSIGKVICDQAKLRQAALVVVASRSNGGLLELIRGSVADYVVHHCQCPVAVLHWPLGKEAHPLSTGIQSTSGGQAAGKHIIVPVDAREDSQAAVKWIVNHLATPNDTVHLLHVEPCHPLLASPSAHFRSGMLPVDLELARHLEEQAQAQAEDWDHDQATPLRALLEEAGVRHASHMLVQPAISSPLMSDGQPSQQGQVEFSRSRGRRVLLHDTEDRAGSVSAAICKLADKLGEHAMIVMPFHHRTPIMDFLLGNVTNYVAHRCSKPVLVLPTFTA